MVNGVISDVHCGNEIKRSIRKLLKVEYEQWYVGLMPLGLVTKIQNGA